MPSLSPTGQPDSASAWFGTVPGQALLDSERVLVAHAFSERPGQSWLWLGPQAQAFAADGRGLRLASAPDGYLGDVRCALPFPLASESIGVVVLQHVVRPGPAGQALLDECARVLVPGGRLWLFALNPLAPYRWRWRGAGLRASEPLSWRRRLRGIGLVPTPVSQGIGPSWRVCVADHVQEGPGLRAAYALSADKRTLPLTPVRRRGAIPLRGRVGRMKAVAIHTDGACLGNPGPGGWAALLRYGEREREVAGGEAQTTNNRMELMAAIMALETLTEACTVVLHTDSQYVRQGITEWMPNWLRRHWKTAAGDPVKNRDLWERLHAATLRHRIDWRWVKGHSGDPDNERVDVLARDEAVKFRHGARA